MGPDGSCNIAQGNVKGEEIPTKVITLGFYRYQSSCFCFSIVKWATGIGISLLDLLSSLGSEMALTTPSSTQDAKRDEPWAAAPQLCCLSGTCTQRDSGSLLFAISLSKLLFKRGNSMRMTGEKHWSSLKCLSGVWPLQGNGHPLVGWFQRTKPLGHWLTLKIIASLLVPGHFKVLQIKIPITPRSEKSKGF